VAKNEKFMKPTRAGLVLTAAWWLGSTVVALHATDWKTNDGKVYQDVKLMHLDADSVTILYADGGARIPLTKLSPDLQRRFGYDPDAARAAAEARAKDDAVNAKALQAEMDQASQQHQAGPEPTVAEADSTQPDSSTATGALPATPVFNSGTHHVMSEIATPAASANSTHHSMDDLTQSATAMRRDLSDPTYHTMAHLVYTVRKEGLGPDRTDPNHHTINEAVDSNNTK
jgi:hypothetical protein